jgi:DNA-binding MarR family transcriptional regulator
LRGAKEEGLACGEICNRMITRDSDITRVLDRLESRGLITRERQTADRRIVRAFISEKGLQILNELDGPVSAWHSARLSGLNDEELKTLINLLEKIRNTKKNEIGG